MTPERLAKLQKAWPHRRDLVIQHISPDRSVRIAEVLELTRFLVPVKRAPAVTAYDADVFDIVCRPVYDRFDRQVGWRLSCEDVELEIHPL